MLAPLHLPAPRESAPLAEFCTQLARFLHARVDPLDIDRRGAIPQALLDELARLGTFGVSLPESCGGAGLGLAGACAVVDTLAQRDRAVATTVGLHLGLGTRGLVAFGSAPQQARWLPELAAGTRIAAFSVTEPGAGSDLSRLQTRIVRGAPGRLRVDGHKVFVTNGGLAGLFTVAAASPGLGDAAAGASLIVLERGDAGLVTGPEEKKLGLRGSSTTPLYLDGVDVPEDRLLGPAGQGQELLGQVLAWGRTIMAAGCTGTARAALDLATRHVVARRQFGRMVASQPVVRRQLADMATDLHTMRCLVARTAAAADEPIERGELERLSIAAKVFCSETDWAICDRALQLLGGSGYIEESGAPLLLRDARITRIFEGANDVLLSRLGAIEVLHPRPPTITGTRADIIAADLSAHVSGLRTAQGMRLLRSPHELHWLGRLAVMRDAALAVAAEDGDATLVAHALERAEQASRAIGLERPDGDAGELICARLIAGARA